jgi:hypothetical protein
MPRKGAHSMIERPEPVRRVAPPSAIITQIAPAIASSQYATARLLVPSPRAAGGRAG